MRYSTILLLLWRWRLAISDFRDFSNFAKCRSRYLLDSQPWWGLGTEEEEGYRTGPPGYIGWRNSFLGIDSGAHTRLKIRALWTLWSLLISFSWQFFLFIPCVNIPSFCIAHKTYTVYNPPLSPLWRKRICTVHLYWALIHKSRFTVILQGT